VIITEILKSNSLEKVSLPLKGSCESLSIFGIGYGCYDFSGKAKNVEDVIQKNNLHHRRPPVL
jgi:hypothetical protein